MKILYHHRIASKDGQYVHIEEIIRSLRKNGEEVIVVAPSVAENQSFGGDGGWVSKLKAKLPTALYEILELFYSFIAFFKLSKAILKHKPDFIYERYNLYTPAGIWAKKLFRIPLILEVNAPLLEERNKFNSIALPALARWSQRYVWRQADKVLPVTQVLADIVKSYGVLPSRIEVIHNGINRDYFKPKVAKVKEPGDQITIGFVGFVREWHKLENMVNLIANEPDKNLKLLIVGDGPAIPGIRELAKTLGVAERVEITGLVSREEMPAQLQKIDIAIQPSVVPYASPLKMIEYLGTGLAIVAPAQENIKELLEHNTNALLFEPENTEACAEKISEFIAQPDLMQRLSYEANQTIDEKGLLWDKNALKIVNHAKQLCTGTIEQRAS
ncbi:glycosyltransferase family 4 protein [Flocculibacter collagenilyticus]|uniref:glycosyltransferase family 4 protein n=1 Tax=Flocculibacter collagenilyticus TaxID=2744479 RepID=UPI0018F71705|nr:glycosyltransferase family 4 protein [Flocculibacter collagenilyticus]